MIDRLGCIRDVGDSLARCDDPSSSWWDRPLANVFVQHVRLCLERMRKTQIQPFWLFLSSFNSFSVTHTAQSHAVSSSIIVSFKVFPKTNCAKSFDKCEKI
jgi:hypothetical protein